MKIIKNIIKKFFLIFNQKLISLNEYESIINEKTKAIKAMKEETIKSIEAIKEEKNKAIKEEKNKAIKEEKIKSTKTEKIILTYADRIKKLKLFQKFQKDNSKIQFLIEFKKLKNISNITLNNSQAQLSQDLIYLNEFGEKKNGYFIEIGASDGILNSNTYLFEKVFQWKGLLIESNEEIINELVKNRPNSKVIKSFVSGESEKKYTYFKAKHFSEINGIEKKLGFETFYDSKEEVYSKNIKTIFIENNVPASIDFMSIDIEGLEIEILENIDFNQFSFKMICIEHNYDNLKCDKIDQILNKHNYTRKYENFSKWDYFYFKKIQD